jgi:hypothetical protein
MALTAGQKAARRAGTYVGVTESGTNRGQDVDRWQRPWGMGYGWPWCGAFAAAMVAYGVTGVEGDVFDDRLGNPVIGNPSTALMYERAKSQGAIISRPMPGAFILWPGTHVGVCADYSPDGRTVVTYEGNAGDAVRQRVRAFGPGTGVVFAAPLAIRNVKPPAPARRYYVEDTGAQPVFRGPWRLRASRERAISGLPEARRARARRVRTARGYGFYEGPRRVYGPWADADARDAQAIVLARSLGRPVRKYSEPVTDRATIITPDELGKTT